MRMNWKEILDKTLAGVYILDSEGRFVYVNDIVERATLYSKEELYSGDIFKITPPEELEKAKEYLRRTINGETIFYEAKYMRKSGEVRWMWGFASPIEIGGKKYCLGSWIDVTRAKRLEKELRNREEFYRALIEESLSPICITQKGKISYVNKAFEEFTGYHRDEMVGKELFIAHPEDRELVEKVCVEGESVGKDRDTFSFRIIREDGKVRWLTIRAEKITYNGEPAIAVTAVDTTAIHEMNAELKRRAEYLSLLNSILRHDIGNALTTISAALEMDDPKLKSLAIEKFGYILRLIADIRNLESAIDVLKPINIAEIVRDISKRYRIEAKLEDIFVYANEGLSSVLENIVSNAFIHGGENLKVVVEAFKNGKWAVCRISDNGRGIPDDIKPRIFEKGFSTTKRTGMGLFIAKWLVEAYGGKIEVRNNIPSGTVFEIRLPTLED
jgi:PAS domain S-box-containing protein